MFNSKAALGVAVLACGGYAVGLGIGAWGGFVYDLKLGHGLGAIVFIAPIVVVLSGAFGIIAGRAK